MARKTGCIRTGETTELRAIAGAIAVDAAALSDANYPAVGSRLTGAIDCTGYETIFVGAEILGGAAPSIAVEALFYDPDGVVDGKLSRVLLGASPGVTPAALAAETTGPLLSGSQYAELRVFGHPQVFLRVTAVANSAGTTSSKILGRPGRVRGDRQLNLASSAIA